MTGVSSQQFPSVVIPVFNAFEALETCLQSVAQTVGSETQVIVVDDASTDERIVPLIDSVVARGGPRWRFVRQPRNQGFVASANLGMALTHGDVVLLNSDTMVTPGWLQGLAKCLASDRAIATATPWTNNGEIVSLPEFCQSNPVPPDAAGIAAAMDGVLDNSGLEKYPELPTAVGFCMAISRAAIDAIGVFDQAQFGRGYGEENDFSLRARAAGLRNVLCGDVYVVHQGGQSFGPLGLRPDEASMQRLLERHPGYQQEISEYVANDPLAAHRAATSRAVLDAGVRFQ